MIAGTILEAIGKTPLIRLARVVPPDAIVLAKLESKNPGGSVKDRPALAMIESAEARGLLTPGTIIVEATSGNTGISLAMISAVRGYKCIVVMPEDMSAERRRIVRAYGAEVVVTPAERGMAGAVSEAERICAREPRAIMPRQFENAANPEAHARGTAKEILESCPEIVAFVAGVGTGGTISGTGRVLKEANAKIRVVAVEPDASAVLSGDAPGLHAIQGLGAGFVPKILARDIIDEVVRVNDVAADTMARRLAREEGLLVGPSSGANVHVAIEIARRVRGPVVTILCDSGERYLG